jgi:hypothetical protein
MQEKRGAKTNNPMMGYMRVVKRKKIRHLFKKKLSFLLILMKKRKSMKKPPRLSTRTSWIGAMILTSLLLFGLLGSEKMTIRYCLVYY